MGLIIDYFDRFTNAKGQVLGSDGRIDASSRTDSRAFYNSRDQRLVFTMPFSASSIAAGAYAAYWQNDDNDRDLVLVKAELFSANEGAFLLHQVTGTAAGGTTQTPACLNRGKTRTAQATAMDASGGTITGLTSSVSVGPFSTDGASGHVICLKDSFRLGPGQAMALEYDEGTTGAVRGFIMAMYENTLV